MEAIAIEKPVRAYHLNTFFDSTRKIGADGIGLWPVAPLSCQIL